MGKCLSITLVIFFTTHNATLPAAADVASSEEMRSVPKSVHVFYLIFNLQPRPTLTQVTSIVTSLQSGHLSDFSHAPSGATKALNNFNHTDNSTPPRSVNRQCVKSVSALKMSPGPNTNLNEIVEVGYFVQ